MATITTRTAKGSPLTTGEMDTNLTNLNNDKLEKGAYTSNSNLLIKDKDGNLTPIVVGELEIVGRIAGGNIKGLSVAEVKTLLGINDLEDAVGAMIVVEHGTTTLVSGTVAVVLTNSYNKVVLTRKTLGAAAGHLAVNYDNPTQFTITSSSGTDNGLVDYIAFKSL